MFFGESRITVSRKHFHNQRAIWLAQQYGIDAIGVNAPDLNKGWNLHTTSGKAGAGWRSAGCQILHRQPKYHKTGVTIGADMAHTGALLASKMPGCVAAHWQSEGVLH